MLPSCRVCLRILVVGKNVSRMSHDAGLRLMAEANGPSRLEVGKFVGVPRDGCL